jgi:phosphate transport system permease protein
MTAETPSVNPISASLYPKRITLKKDGGREFRAKAIMSVFLLAASVSIITTLGILFSLIGETIGFFQEVSFAQFFFDTQWTPLFADKRFGIWALVSGTVLTSLIALIVAVPLGLLSAVYLSEFASARARAILKPSLEILSGIPTVVYGFFALTFVTPLLRNIFPEISGFNSLSAGLVMGVMIIPLVASLSEDSMSAVPNSLREGAYALGVTKFEMATRVIFPAALSGIIASLILALSRAVGETMIVAIAAGANPTFTFDPLVPVQTMTGYIVQVSLGDTPYGSLSYKTIFAVGTTLFFFTFLLNIFSNWIVRRFREVYE